MSLKLYLRVGTTAAFTSKLGKYANMFEDKEDHKGYTAAECNTLMMTSTIFQYTLSKRQIADNIENTIDELIMRKC